MSGNDDLIDRLRIDDASRVQPHARWTWPLVALIVVAVLVAAAWFWFSSGRGVEVSVLQAELIDSDAQASAASVLDASGFVVARRQATVAAEVTGKLTEVLVEEGMEVAVGQVLARLDDSTEQARLALSRARLAASERTVQEVEVRLDDARRTLNRLDSLRARELVSQADLDQADTAVNSLSAQLDSARQQGQVARRELELQEQLLDQLTVRAPFAGVVIARAAQAGEMVSPISAGGGFTRTGICTIVDMSSLEIEVDVNESFIDRVSSGQSVVAILDAYPDWEIAAEVTTVVPAADRQKATVRVRIGFVELDQRILPDMGIRVRFLESAPSSQVAAGSSPRRQLAIPDHAILERAGSSVVFVVKDGLVERRAVRTGGTRDALTFVIAGLSENESVVANIDELELEDGDRIRVVDD